MAHLPSLCSCTLSLPPPFAHTRYRYPVMMPHRMFVERYRRFVRDGALPVPRKVVFPPEAAVWRECAELVVGLMPTNPEHLQVVAPRCSLHALARGDVAVELVLFRARWQACRYRFLVAGNAHVYACCVEASAASRLTDFFLAVLTTRRLGARVYFFDSLPTTLQKSSAPAPRI
jgi:hypothetical protein